MSKPQLYRLEPEVPGGLGPRSVCTYTSGPETEGQSVLQDVIFLHLMVDGWMGDDLLTTHPCFIATQQLHDAMRAIELTGWGMSDAMEVKKSSTFLELQPETQLPNLIRLTPTGYVIDDPTTKQYEQWSGHDLCMSPRKHLVVTRKALDVIQSLPHALCDVTELSPRR